MRSALMLLGLVACADPAADAIVVDLADAHATVSDEGNDVTVDGGFTLTVSRPGSPEQAGRVLIDAITVSIPDLASVNATSLTAIPAFPLELTGGESETVDVQFFGRAPDALLAPTTDPLCPGGEVVKSPGTLDVTLFDEPNRHKATGFPWSTPIPLTDSRSSTLPVIENVLDNRWHYQLGSPADDTLHDLDVHRSGEVAMVLSTSGDVTIGGETHRGDLVVKLDAEGQAAWARPLGQASLVAMGDGAVWVADALAADPPDAQQPFIAHYGADGTILDTIELPNALAIYSLTSMPQGGLLVVASESGEQDRSRVTRFTANGDEVWSLVLSSWWAQASVDVSGGIWLKGAFDAELDFGGVTLTPFQPFSSFLARLDADGTATFARDVSHCGDGHTTVTPNNTLLMACFLDLVEVDASGTDLGTSFLPVNVNHVRGLVADDRGHVTVLGFLGRIFEFDASGIELSHRLVGCGEQTHVAASPDGSAVVVGHTGSGYFGFTSPPLASVGAQDIAVGRIH